MTVSTTNQTAATADTIIQAASSSAVTIIQGLITADSPWLGIPVVKTVFGWVLAWILGYVSLAIQKGVSFAIIDAQVSSQQSALSKALASLQMAESGGNADEIQAAIKAYAEAQSNIANYNGSSPISK